MELWWKHTLPIAETCAYCLLGNHFHAAVYIREQEELTGLENLSALKQRQGKPPGQYFSNFFNAYARGVNLATGRSGALFERPFERRQVTTANYLMRLIIYIHQNPQKHGFMDDFRGWPYSSYLSLIDHSPTKLERNKVLELFGGREGFIRLHDEVQTSVELDDE